MRNLLDIYEGIFDDPDIEDSTSEQSAELLQKIREWITKGVNRSANELWAWMEKQDLISTKQSYDFYKYPIIFALVTSSEGAIPRIIIHSFGNDISYKGKTGNMIELRFKPDGSYKIFILKHLRSKTLFVSKSVTNLILPVDDLFVKAFLNTVEKDL